MMASQLLHKLKKVVTLMVLAGPLVVGLAEALPQSNDRFMQQLGPALVRVAGYMGNGDSGNESPMYGQSSGFFFDRNGLLLTTYSPYVALETKTLCEKFEIELYDGTTRTAGVLAIDPVLDIAILETTPASDNPALDITAPTEVDIAEEVWAVAGRSSGDEPLVFSGRVKAKDETSLYGSGIGDLLINTYMELPEYAYGGPLVNARGEVLGLNIRYPHLDNNGAEVSGEGHAVPVSSIATIYRVLLANPTFEQKWLGFGTRRLSVQEGALTKRLLQRRGGVVIDFVWQEGPAAQSDIRRGDILVEMNGDRVLTTTHFKRMLFDTANETTIDLKLIRDGSILSTRSLVQTRPRWAAP